MPNLPTDPNSISEVLRASAILLIKIIDVSFSEWVALQDLGGSQRTVQLTLSIEKSLKNELYELLQTPISTTIEQRQPSGYRIMDDLGVWSSVNLRPGIELLALCTGNYNTDVESVGQLLATNCEFLLNPDEVLAEVQPLIALESEEYKSKTRIEMARADLTNKGPIFARYFWAKVKTGAFSSETRFEDVMNMLTDPMLSVGALDNLLTYINDDLSMQVEPSRDIELAFARTLLKLRTLSVASPLYDAIESVYLPNLIGLGDIEERFTSHELYPDSAASRDEMVNNLAAQSQSDALKLILEWLRQ